jgi:hypothetical protein
MCDSQDLTLQPILSNGVATVRQTLSRLFSAMAAEWANRLRKLVSWPGYILAGGDELPDDAALRKQGGQVERQPPDHRQPTC